MTTKLDNTPLQLRWEEKNREVVVTPADQDRFVVTVQAAVRACQAGEDSIKFDRQFNRLLERLGLWVRQHVGDIDKAYVTIRDADLLFLVVRKAVRYDGTIEDALTDLDIEVARNPELDLVRMSVLSLPHGGQDLIASFLGPGQTLEYRHA